MLRFETTLALRHLRSGGGQTALTVAAVATGVLLVVFTASMLFGFRRHVQEMLTDTLPHVVVQPPAPEPAALPADVLPPGGIALRRIERQAAQRKGIDRWAQAVEVIAALPDVRAVAATVTGEASLIRGAKQVGVRVTGADPAALDAVTPLTKYLSAGRYRDLRAGEVVVSYTAADDLGVIPGDRVHLATTDGTNLPFTVVGIYDPGQEIRAAYVTFRSGQSLLGTGAAARTLLVHCRDLFDAEQVADQIATLLPYRADSWSRTYPQFVSWLGMYGTIAYISSGFTLVAAGFSIASVLVVGVLQKSKQIGILKSLGARRHQILAVFLIEGLGIAVGGAATGLAGGIALIKVLGLLKMPPAHPGGRIEPLFPFDLTPGMAAIIVGVSVLTTLLAAVLPARRAACLDPVQAMR